MELPVTQSQGLARGVDPRLTSSGERIQAIEQEVCMEGSDMPPLIRVSDEITASSVERSIGGLITFLGFDARHNDNYHADLLSGRMGREETDSDIDVEVEVVLEWRRRRRVRRNIAL